MHRDLGSRAPSPRPGGSSRGSGGQARWRSGRRRESGDAFPLRPPVVCPPGWDTEQPEASAALGPRVLHHLPPPPLAVEA